MNQSSIEELQIEFLVMVSGKSKIIPQLMWMRNREVPSVNEKNPQFRLSIIKEWWFDKNYVNEKIDFLNTMKKACDKILNNKSLEITPEKISMLFELYISKPVFKKNTLKRIVNFFQIQKKKIIKFILGRDQIKYNSIIDQAKLLEFQGVLINYEELSEIISILQYSKKGLK